MYGQKHIIIDAKSMEYLNKSFSPSSLRVKGNMKSNEVCFFEGWLHFYTPILNLNFSKIIIRCFLPL
jgi:hypothetical protein